ncbi:MAG: oxidoreductase, partial [Thaumarchaeota archaeon]|nr:oxidoreductase [Nitrososphaerota archaeon]
MSGSEGKVRLAVFKLSSCSGCQQAIIDLGEQLLALLGQVEIAYFLEASSKAEPGPYDVTLIEGSVSTPHEEELVKKIRENSRTVVAIGSCATYGGIQALRNWMNFDDVKSTVYQRPDWIKALEKSRPVSDFIKVDYMVSGCPVNKLQLLSVLKQILIGKRAYYREESLCQECKRKGNVCVIV